jgi:predicted MFS family arabinose efflux permease
MIAVWGFVHGAGFVIEQVWIAATAPKAPTIDSDLTVSFANLGIAAGAALGCLAIATTSTYIVVWIY